MKNMKNTENCTANCVTNYETSNSIKSVTKYAIVVVISILSTVILYLLIPVGKVNDEYVFRYQLWQYQMDTRDNDIKRIAKQMAFERAMQEMGITVSDEEINNELKSITEKYGGENSLKQYLIDTSSGIACLKASILNGLLKQKALAKFVGSDEEKNKAYDEYIQKYEDSICIKIY